jgi:hypothetical protein
MRATEGDFDSEDHRGDLKGLKPTIVNDLEGAAEAAPFQGQSLGKVKILDIQG